MYLTVGICTWNRAELLDQTLNSLRRLVVPHSLQWEVLVVNNNCTDRTDEVIAAQADHLPLCRLFEPTPGKSHALNLAVREARGEYILWTDDDVLVEPDWMQCYAEAFAQWPEAAVFGGPIRPWFSNTPPDWLERVLPVVANAYAVRDLGDIPVLLSRDALPFGANMAVRMKEQRQYLYDTRLGPRPGSAVRGEEVELVLKMLDAGVQGRWVPKAAVYHHIPLHRQSISYLASYYRGAGEGNALRRLNAKRGNQSADGTLLKLSMRALVEEMKYRIRRVHSEPEVWIRHLIRVNIAWGEVSAAKQAQRIGT